MSTEEENEKTITIKPHSNISKTVTKCLGILVPDETHQTSSPVLNIIADAKVSGKAITITEIIKRRLKESGKTINQSTQIQEKPIVVAVLPKEDQTRKHL